MHFLGSFALGLFIIWFVFLSELFWKSVPNKKTIFFAVILSMIVIGGVWELFEYTNNLTESTEGYTKDVVHDMISVFVGAVLAGYVGSRENKNV
ncbi:MAG: putative membrane protein (4 TMH) [Parcubacteria bacterium C7867-005]|nr:MAG: putative membrane protein (4 TMH) [Parcubacteria bacterium C7867-005]